MKRSFAFFPVLAAVFALAFSSCENPSGGGGGGGGGGVVNTQAADTQKYKNAGATVASRPWSDDYDCSNFSTQFYQNCYKTGLPCRVRLGTAGGGFTAGNHAWNSVKINGQWVDWEPQLNAAYSGHTKTSTPVAGVFTEEDIARILYEGVGRYVPSIVISQYEIDKYLFENSPFNQYFVKVAECISDNPAANASLIAQLSSNLPKNGDGDMYISNDYLHLAWVFKHNNKYYIIVDVEETDPVEGRQVLKPKTPASDFTEILDLHISY